MNFSALPRLVRPGLIPAAVLVLAASFVAQSAIADQFDTLNVVLGTTLRYNANVFGTPDSSAPQPGFSTKGDHITDYSVGLRIDKQYSLQRFHLEVNETKTRYNTFTYLDADALNYRGEWRWALTPRWTGTLGADRAQSQVSFTLNGGTQKNTSTVNNRNFTLDGWMFGGWHILGGYRHTDSETEQNLVSSPSFQSHRVEGGLRYVAQSGNSITFMQRSAPTPLNQPLDPVNLIDTNYTDTESELRVHWNRGKSSLDGNLTYKKRTNEHFAVRNFSGTAGELRYDWTPTGKLHFNITSTRAILPYLAFGNTIENSSYKVDRILLLASEWNVDAKITVRLNFARTLSDYRGPAFAPPPSPVRNDEFRIARIGVVWIPARFVTLNASLERSQRTSNNASFEFTDTIATVGALVNF